jgi:hypothetical protein
MDDFPINANTISIFTSTVANIIPATATINLFSIINSSDIKDSYVGIYDTQEAAAAATLEEMYQFGPMEYKLITSPFVTTVDSGVSRTVYAVAITPDKLPDNQPIVVVTPMES